MDGVARLFWSLSYRVGSHGKWVFSPRAGGEHDLIMTKMPVYLVHPRVRGEHRLISASISCISGSSPRPRGTLALDDLGEVRLRFIPASAGNTPAPWRSSRPDPVHPRVRGEHGQYAARAVRRIGSSPRPRGTLVWVSIPNSARRFIPASAGNTSRVATIRSCGTVHPRVRGEHNSSPFFVFPLRGSSPRPRGTPVEYHRNPSDIRFIPASAGNTRSGQRAGRSAAVHPRVRGEHFC